MCIPPPLGEGRVGAAFRPEGSRGRPVAWVARRRHFHAGLPIGSVSLLRHNLEPAGRPDLRQLPQPAAPAAGELRTARLRTRPARPALWAAGLPPAGLPAAAPVSGRSRRLSRATGPAGPAGPVPVLCPARL